MIVIWSLLTQETPFYSARDFWEFLITNNGTVVSTAFIFNRVPRVSDRRGLGWAPAYPSVHSSGHASRSKPYVSAFTTQGAPIEEGFSAPWATYVFDCGSNEALAQLTSELQDIATRHLKGYPKGILLRLLDRDFYPFEARTLGNDPERLFTAVCASQDGHVWEWKGLHRWRRIDQLPRLWQILDILLV